MHTLDNSPKNRLPVEFSAAPIGHCFPCEANIKLEIGTLVRLADDGLVYPVTANTELPIGYVRVPNEFDKTKVTVGLFAVAKVVGKAKVELEAGALVMATYDAETGTEYDVATTGKYAVGIVLGAADAGAAVSVALNYTPNKI